MTFNERPVEAIDLTEVGPEERDVEVYRSPARTQFTFPPPRPFQTMSRRRDGPDLRVPEEKPKFLGEFV